MVGQSTGSSIVFSSQEWNSTLSNTIGHRVTLSLLVYLSLTPSCLLPRTTSKPGPFGHQLDTTSSTSPRYLVLRSSVPGSSTPPSIPLREPRPAPGSAPCISEGLPRQSAARVGGRKGGAILRVFLGSDEKGEKAGPPGRTAPHWSLPR